MTEKEEKEELIEYIKHATICGYSFDELMVFADACRMQNISEADLHEFCLNCESAWQYIIEKTHEEIEKEMERQTSTWGSFSA